MQSYRKQVMNTLLYCGIPTTCRDPLSLLWKEGIEPLGIYPSPFLVIAYRTGMNSHCEVAEMSLRWYRGFLSPSLTQCG